MKELCIKVWQDDAMDWLDYTPEELDKYFKFTTKPNWKNVREVYLHNIGDNWMEIVFKNNKAQIYNNVFGVYVEQ